MRVLKLDCNNFANFRFGVADGQLDFAGMRRCDRFGGGEGCNRQEGANHQAGQYRGHKAFGNLYLHSTTAYQFVIEIVKTTWAASTSDALGASRDTLAK